jgi:hypothetical protein
MLDGSVQFMGPSYFVAPPAVAVEIARAFLHEAGAEVIFADPGSTVIRAPHNGNGNGLIR